MNDNLPCTCNECVRKRKLRIKSCDKELIDWICFDCAERAKVKCRSEVVTVHQALCPCCGKQKEVVNIRDYGWPQIFSGQYVE